MIDEYNIMPAPKRILIIDDEVDLCLLLKTYLTAKSYEVHIAHSLTKGTALIEMIKPDVLFLDNNLPDGNGWEHIIPMAQKHPAMEFFLMSAYQPRLPPIPTETKYTIIEKPISFSDLNNRF